MSMTRYGTLFEVEVLHDYFLSLGGRVREALAEEQRLGASRAYSAKNFLDVLPTGRSERTLAGHQLIFKTTAAGFLVGVKLDPAAAGDRPAVAPGGDFRLVFALRVTDPRFFNYTTLAAGSAPSFLHLGNRSGNVAPSGRFLSLPVPAFDTGRLYEAGEVRAVSGATVDLFRAIRDTGPSATPVAADWERIPPDTYDPVVAYSAGAVVLFQNRLFRALVNGPGTDLNDATDWELLGALANQYVTSADARALRAARFSLDFTAAALPQATVRLIRPGESVPAWQNLYTAASGNLGSVQVELRGLSPGAYRLEVLDGTLTVVSGLTQQLYVDSDAVRGAWFGVIEIGLGTGDMALLATDGAIRSPRYTVRFLNRATRWRYIFPSTQAVGSGAEVTQEGGSGLVLVTDRPRPLTRFGTGIRLQADVTTTPASEEVLLPEPEANLIRRQNNQWYSEIHMSNVPI